MILAVFVVAEILSSFVLVFTGAYLHARYGQVLGYRMRAPDSDPHQHCDRHPVRCTYRAILADAKADNDRAQTYGETLEAVAGCPNCPSCARAALAALAT